MSESFNRVRRFTEIRSANYRSRPCVIETVHEYVGPDAVAHDLTEHDLEQVVAEHSALVAEVEELRAKLQAKLPGRGFLAQAYANGGYDAIAAYRAPGWAEREAGWKKYLAEVDDDGPWIVSQQARQIDAAPQQPERGGEA